VTRARAAAGSLLFLVVAPGVAAGLVPWLLTGWDSTDPPVALAIAGGVLIACGTAVLLSAFARFVIEGIGTPAPVAPPSRLVIGGLYRYVRNPMYLAVAAVAAFVYGYEQHTLSERFGEEYDEYRRNVPAWWPRLRPWSPSASAGRPSDGGA
jgi:protein-S-isoprenylcysteine O-methyltransferase Ste14